jgi:uncharacterized protein
MALLNQIEILKLIAQDPWRMHALHIASTLNLPDWWIGAGFVRNCVWDALHGYSTPTPLNDIDLIYFAADIPSEKIESDLNVMASLWEVTNQATVHNFNQQAAYKNSIDALSRWTETATCVAVTLGPQPIAGLENLQIDGGFYLSLAAPYGVEDLVLGKVRFTPHPEAKRHVYEDRVKNRDWFNKWPLLRLA